MSKMSATSLTFTSSGRGYGGGEGGGGEGGGGEGGGGKSPLNDPCARMTAALG
jgi:hypothetical protein